MNLPKVDNSKKASASTSYFSSFNPLKSVKNSLASTNTKINAAKDSVNKTITNKINATKDSMNTAKKDLKNSSSSSLSSLKENVKANYQEWLKYGVFFLLVGYVLFIVVGLFGLPPDTLHNLFSFLTSFLDYFRLDYTSIGKPPQSDNEVEEGKGIQMNFKKK